MYPARERKRLVQSVALVACDQSEGVRETRLRQLAGKLDAQSLDIVETGRAVKRRWRPLKLPR